MTGAPIIKKVPGKPVKFDHEKDGFVSLGNLTKTELLDLSYREEKLLNNKKFLERLPDKGEKVKKFLEEVRAELQKRNEHEKLCGLLAKLDVNDSKNALDKLEWTGRYECDELCKSKDDQDTNPLKILATHSSTSASKDKQIRVLEPEIRLVDNPTPLDSSATNLDEVDVYAKQLCQKIDSSKAESVKKKFYTHRPLNMTSVKDLVSPKSPSVDGTTKNTNSTKMLSLSESIVIQQEQTKLLKEIELRRAVEKLSEKNHVSLQNAFTNISEYRTQLVFDSDDECSQGSESQTQSDEECDQSVLT